MTLLFMNIQRTPFFNPYPSHQRLAGNKIYFGGIPQPVKHLFPPSQEQEAIGLISDTAAAWWRWAWEQVGKRHNDAVNIVNKETLDHLQQAIKEVVQKHLTKKGVYYQRAAFHTDYNPDMEMLFGQVFEHPALAPDERERLNRSCPFKTRMYIYPNGSIKVTIEGTSWTTVH